MDGKLKEDNKLFNQLLAITIIIITFSLLIFSKVIISDNQLIYRTFLVTIFILLIITFTFVLFGTVIMMFSKPYKKTHPIILKWMKVAFKAFYPCIYFTGCLFGLEKDKIRGKFTYVNNYLVSKEIFNVSSSEVLLLIPHCIQRANCPHKITNDIKNCKMCGKCKVKDLIELSQKYKTHLAVVTGGTLARSTIIKNKPKGIVAIACERDLCSGIQDVKVIPVLGIVNERPEGPCYNTGVDVTKVEEAILYFLNGGEE